MRNAQDPADRCSYNVGLLESKPKIHDEQSKRTTSPGRATVVVLACSAVIALCILLLRGAFVVRQASPEVLQQLYATTADADVLGIPRQPPSLVFVTAFIDLGPDHTEKSTATRLEHFRTLASSGIDLILFASPSYMGMLEGLQVEFPNILRVEPIEMESLATVQTIRTFPNLDRPASLTSHKDTNGFLELMLSKIDFVHAAMPLTEATHLAWIDFNIAHVFKTVDALHALSQLGHRRRLRSPLLALAAIWSKGTRADLESLLSAVNWRFAGGFFVGDRHSLEQWYALSCDALPIFLAQTNTLVWEVNFWAWLEQAYPHSFTPYAYTSDHDDSLVYIPKEVDVQE